jgi:adenylate cyclase class 2
MPAEVELKFKVTDFGKIREILRKTGAAVIHEPAHERNLVLDTADRNIGKAGKLLRIRQYGDEVFLTVKQPVQPGPMKSRIENELKIDDTFEEAWRMFEKIGCLPVYEYEKTREIWLCNGSHVCLDSLFFGMFVEIEADSEEKVAATAALLGFDPAKGLRQSYSLLENRHKYSNS